MEWIETKKELPNIPDGQMKPVMGFDGYRQVLVNFYNDEGKRFRVDCLKCFNEVTENITHWKYLDSDPHQPRLTWQYELQTEPNVWHDATESEYSVGQHLSKYKWRQIEK